MVDYNALIKIHVVQNTPIPCIRNTRIPIYSVLGMLAEDRSFEDVLQSSPELTHQDILACLAFAADQKPKPIIIRNRKKEHLSLLITWFFFLSLCCFSAIFYASL